MGRIKLYDIINESIERDMFEGFDETELSEDYPVGFDLEEFKNIGSYAAKLRYAEEYLGKPLGQGTSRVVYRVDEDKVLKLAKNKKGIAQNNAETDWYNTSYYESILAKVIDFDDKNELWVEMELAYKVKKSDFKRLWGVDFDTIGLYLTNRDSENNGRRSIYGLDDDVKYVLDESDEVMNLVSFMFDSGSSPGDLGKLNSWGIVHRPEGEEIVLIDFGLTSGVYQSYYS